MKRYLFLIFSICILFAKTNAQNIGDTLDVLHYSIHIQEVNTGEQEIVGSTDITFVTMMNGLSEVSFNLQNLLVDSVVIDGQQLTFNQQNKWMQIYLDAPLQQGDTVTASVYYHGQPFHEDWGGFHFSGDYSFNLGVGFESIPHNLGKTWFPCVDNFTDRATYDVYTTLNDNSLATGGGLLNSVTDNGDGTKTWQWKITHEIPTYLVSVATGEYVPYFDTYYGIADTVPIEIYTRPADTGKVQGSFLNIHPIMDFFEASFGAYPFEKIGYTGTAIGAMEHVGNIAYPSFAINGNTSYESLYTHELSHMWFGNAVTCSAAEDMWLNEGWATFCELYYLEHLYSHQSYIAAMRTMHKEMLLKAHEIDGGYWALNNVPQSVTYGKTSYDKGGTVVNALRGYLGDSLFFETVKAYLSHFAYQSVSSEQMRDFMSDYTGIDMNGFFDAWVFTPGTPHFSIDSTHISPVGSEFQVDVYLQQKYKGADFLAQDVVVQVGFMHENFQIEIDTVHFSGAAGHSVKMLDFIPVAIMIDPFETACDATTDSYRVFTEPVEYAYPDAYFKLYLDACSDSSLLRVTHHWAAPDSLKTPVEGLRLSPYRYWQTEGFLGVDFQARGRFYFSQGGYLDGGLITSDNDSVVMLYRENAADEWHMVAQELIGTWMIGYIFVDNLQLGEYTLAVWDKTIVSDEDLVADRDQVQVFPNPSHGEVSFRFPEVGEYKVVLTDEAGRQIESFTSSATETLWKPKYPVTGIIVATVFSNGKVVASKKILLQ